MKDKYYNNIKSYLNDEIGKIDELKTELSKCQGNSRIIRRAKGSILHDFYNACERIFEIIAREIDGGVIHGDKWHKSLLYQMTKSNFKERPQVISTKLAAELEEYLAFRHLFRNIYGFELEGDRLSRLVEKFDEISNLFVTEIKSFIKKL
ncbi:MAG: hypothetical protein ACQEP2_02885 [Actinomycetota bacterium]